MKVRLRLMVVLTLLVGVMSVAVVPMPEAHAAEPPTTTALWFVCGANDITVRTQPGGSTIGTLYRGDDFYVTQYDGAWAYGYAYRLSRYGWVLRQYLCR